MLLETDESGKVTSETRQKILLYLKRHSAQHTFHLGRARKKHKALRIEGFMQKTNKLLVVVD
jgi:ribosomal protein L31